jgi:hypothetical protein
VLRHEGRLRQRRGSVVLPRAVCRLVDPEVRRPRGLLVVQGASGADATRAQAGALKPYQRHRPSYLGILRLMRSRNVASSEPEGNTLRGRTVNASTP